MSCYQLCLKGWRNSHKGLSERAYGTSMFTDKNSSKLYATKVCGKILWTFRRTLQPVSIFIYASLKYKTSDRTFLTKKNKIRSNDAAHPGWHGSRSHCHVSYNCWIELCCIDIKHGKGRSDSKFSQHHQDGRQEVKACGKTERQGFYSHFIKHLCTLLPFIPIMFSLYTLPKAVLWETNWKYAF